MRFLIVNLNPASVSASLMGAMKSSMSLSLEAMFLLMRSEISLYSSGSLNLSQMFSISDLTP